MSDPKNIDERQFRAMLELLDDEDPEVSEHVWDRLLAMGHEALARLEAVWMEQSNPEAQKRLEEVMHRLNMKDVAGQLLEWRKGGGADLLEGWFLVSRYQFPELEFGRYRNEVKRLVNKTWLELNERMDPQEKIRMVNHMLFRLEGYGPNKHRPNFPNNGFLNYVIEQQSGNVFSLGMLYLVICKQLDLPVSGVLLPGYFILVYRDEHAEFFIDPINGGRTFSKEKLRSYLKQMNIEEKASFFKPTSNIYIVLSLIRALMTDYESHGRTDKVADLEELLEDINITF